MIRTHARQQMVPSSLSGTEFTRVSEHYIFASFAPYFQGCRHRWSKFFDLLHIIDELIRDSVCS